MEPPAPTPDRRPNEPGSRQLRLEKRLARAALERYGLGDARLRVLSWRRQARVFRVLCRSRGKFVLRLYGVPQAGEREAGITPALRHTGVRLRSPDVLRAQLSWLSALGSETDLLAPEPLPMDDGSLLGRLSLEDASARKDRNFVVLRWVPGKNKKGEDLEPKDMSLAGSYVARLHRHAEGYKIPRGDTLPRWDWEWPFGESAPLWSKGEAFYSSAEMGAFRAAARRVRDDLEALGEHSGAFGVLHRDLTLGNLLFRRGRVGAVDFDLCGLGYYLYDLARVRSSLVQHRGGPPGPLWAAFLEGYERERPLPEDYQRRLTAFDAMQKVAAVNRQIVLLSSGNAFGRSRGPEFLACVARWLEEWREGG